MFKDKKILGLIPARGGSKQIPRKNVKPLGGKPLIYWTIAAARKSAHLDRLIVSTDDKEIARSASQQGCEVPFLRPSSLAKDESGSIEVILHALGELEQEYDYVLLLQPTSPFRPPGVIDRFVEFAINKSADAAVSVCRAPKHPSYLFEIVDNQLSPCMEGATKQVRRQDMPKAYQHDGALYLATPSFLHCVGSFNHPGIYAFEQEGIATLDVDTPEDWDYAEFAIDKYPYIKEDLNF